MKYLSIIAVLLTLMFSGCGGSGGSKSTASTQNSDTTVAETEVVLDVNAPPTYDKSNLSYTHFGVRGH